MPETDVARMAEDATNPTVFVIMIRVPCLRLAARLGSAANRASSILSREKSRVLGHAEPVNMTKMPLAVVIGASVS